MDSILFNLSIMIVPGLLAITCHEVSHGYVADRLGDNTARNMGRLTLNPLKHLDLIGTLAIFIIHIGWAKPVPVNFNNLRHPKRDMVWVAAAGPLTNFSLAFFSAMILRCVVSLPPAISAAPIARMIIEPICLNLVFSVYINLILGFFNLIPVPPLDGGRVMVGLLPYRQAAALAGIERYGMIIILLVVVLFPGALWSVLSPPLNFGINILIGQDVLKYLFDHTSLRQLGII